MGVWWEPRLEVRQGWTFWPQGLRRRSGFYPKGHRSPSSGQWVGVHQAFILQDPGTLHTDLSPN